jgi:hypothetical protein
VVRRPDKVLIVLPGAWEKSLKPIKTLTTKQGGATELNQDASVTICESRGDSRYLQVARDAEPARRSI